MLEVSLRSGGREHEVLIETVKAFVLLVVKVSKGGSLLGSDILNAA